MVKKLFLLSIIAVLGACGTGKSNIVNSSSQANFHEIYTKVLKNAGSELILMAHAGETYGFNGIPIYYAGLLYQHDYYDSSNNIVKFCAEVSEGEDTHKIGFQTNIFINLETGFMTIRGSQGNNADDYYSTVIMEASYDLKNDKLGDFYIATSSLDSNHNPSDCNVLRRKDGIVTKLEDNENILNEFKTKLKPYVDKIPYAYLEEDEEKVKSYAKDYSDAFEYFDNI